MTMVQLRLPQLLLMYACLMGLILTTMPVFAQDQQQGDSRQPPSADEIVAMMQSKLNLTQDQVTAITPVIEKYSSKRDELRQSMEDGTGDRNNIRSQMKQLKADEGQELSQFLSTGQLSQWEQMMAQGKHKNHSDAGAGSPEPSGGNS